MKTVPSLLAVLGRPAFFTTCAIWLVSTALVSAFPVITNVVETGGDLDMSGGNYDTGPAQWTGVTFSSHQAGEPVPGLAAGAPYTVGPFGQHAPAYVDRNHRYTNAVPAAMPPYLLGQEYIMCGNDNRDNTSYRLDVSVATPVEVYLLIDNRLNDGNNANPPTFGPAFMQWVVDEGWTPVLNGLNRTANPAVPDEVGIDENADGSINQWFSVYKKSFPAGTFQLKQADNSGRNMYGVVVKAAVAPAAPSNLIASGFDGRVNLTWSAASGATGYYIKRAEVSGGPYTTIATNATTSYDDTTVVNGTTYYYVVSAYNAVGEGPDSNEATATPKSAPANLVATGGTNQIVLTWDALAGAVDYVVLRSDVSGGPYTMIATNVAATTYTDTPLPAGRTYYYVVHGVLAGGDLSGLSSPVSATTAPSAPADFTATLFAATAARLTWSNTSAGIVNTLIEQSTNGVDFTEIGAVAPTGQIYFATGLLPSTLYYFRARATNSSGSSDYSALGTVTTPAGGWNVNFANAAAPTPPGYLQDVGNLYGDRGNGYFYGWATLGGTNITVDARWRQNANSPDLRYDTFNHLMKSGTQDPSLSAWWEIEIPNGLYAVHIVAGDVTAVDSVFQFNVEGQLTGTYTPVAGAWWGDFVLSNVVVLDGRLTVNSAPAARNNKINFIDIYPLIPDPIVIDTHPQSQTNYENRTVSFTVTTSAGTPPFFYQWYYATNGTTNAIAGATNATHTIPLVQLGDAGGYFVVISNVVGAVTSEAATLTVLEDLVGPVVVSVGSLNGQQVGVVFDELIDLGVGASPSQYWLNGGIAPTQAVVRPDGRTVLLSFDTPVAGGFTLDVFEMYDIKGNYTFSSSAAGVVLKPAATNSDVGVGPGTLDPLYGGSAFVGSSNNLIEVLAGGTGYPDVTTDGFHFVAEARTGDFGMKVRVNSLWAATALSKAGLMVRESFNANERHVGIHATPAAAQGGANQIQLLHRPALDSNTVLQTAAALPGYPLWLKLWRQGDRFIAFYGTNGMDWTVLGTNTPPNPYAGTVFAGLATAANLNTPSNYTAAPYEGWEFLTPPGIVSGPEPAVVSVGIHTNVTFANLVVSGPGPFTYQWRKNGLPIPGATNDSLTLTNVAVADSGAYSVVVANEGGAVVSGDLSLTVVNELAIVGPDTLQATQNVAHVFPGANLLANDTDPEGDPLSVIAVSGVPPVTFATDFNSGLPAGTALGTLAGSGASISSSNGVGGSGCLQLNQAAGTQGGYFIVSNLAPGRAVSAFDARFKVLLTQGSANPADGFSFSLGANPTAFNASGAEEGLNNGLAIGFDNYNNGASEVPVANGAPSFTIWWNGVAVATVMTSKMQSPDYVEIAIRLYPDGKLDLRAGGTNVFTGLQTPYVPLSGSFVLAARTGGEWETHWIDDLSISILTATTPRGGTVAFDSGTGQITYTPPADGCGNDSFYYVVTDGQLDGEVTGAVSVFIQEAVPEPPVILSCAPPQNLPADAATCLVPAPDLTTSLVATDNCCCLTISQAPPVGTPLGIGANPIQLTVTDAMGNSVSCMSTVTVVDATAPEIAICPATPRQLPVDAACQALVPDLRGEVVYTEMCSLPVTVLQNPAPGQPVTVGNHPVTVTVIDAAGNSTGCVAVLNVRDLTPPTMTCPPPTLALVVDTNTCQIALPDLTPADLADNCGEVTFTQTPEPGTLLTVGTTNVTLLAVDAANNQTTCTVQVTVTDPITTLDLAIELQGTNAVVSWPVTCATWTLQQADHLGPAPVNWQPVGETPVQNGGRWQVTVPAVDNRFFRLTRSAP